MAVFTIDYRTATPRTSPSLSKRVWMGLQQAVTLHRTRQLLAAMDDRALSDIGVTRAQVGHAVDHPIWDAGLR